MSAGRVMILAACVAAAVGAGGLMMFGAAPVRVFGVMSVGITDEGMDPLPAAIGHFLPSAICALLVAIGVAAACAGFGLPSRRRSITFVGRVLVALGGAGTIAAAVPIAVGILAIRSTFHVMAAAATAPRPEELQEAIDQSAPLLSTGYGGIAGRHGAAAVGGSDWLPQAADESLVCDQAADARGDGGVCRAVLCGGVLSELAQQFRAGQPVADCRRRSQAGGACRTPQRDPHVLAAGLHDADAAGRRAGGCPDCSRSDPRSTERRSGGPYPNPAARCASSRAVRFPSARLRNKSAASALHNVQAGGGSSPARGPA